MNYGKPAPESPIPGKRKADINDFIREDTENGLFEKREREKYQPSNIYLKQLFSIAELMDDIRAINDKATMDKYKKDFNL